MPVNKIEGAEIAAGILDGAAGLARLLVPFTSGGAAVAIGGLAGAAELVARLVRAGIHPNEAIAVWGSSIPDVRAANARIDALIAERTTP